MATMTEETDDCMTNDTGQTSSLIVFSSRWTRPVGNPSASGSGRLSASGRCEQPATGLPNLLVTGVDRPTAGNGGCRAR
jgi:hypothetical protein